MGRKKAQTIGYKYYAYGHFVLCHGPIDAITKISFQDKAAYEVEKSANTTIYINKPSLFGGDESSGGVQGNIDLLFGYQDQEKNATIKKICGDLVSAWRGITSVVFNNVYIGTSPSMPDSKWRVKRIHTVQDGATQWYDEKAEILVPALDGEPSYSFDQLSWEMRGDTRGYTKDNFFNQFTINSSSYADNHIFDLPLKITTSSELRQVIGGETVNNISWIKKGGVYGDNPLFNQYYIQISDPPSIYYFNVGTSEYPFDDTERTAKITVQVKNGATVTCVCNATDAYMAPRKSDGIFYQFMNFESSNSEDSDLNPAHIIREYLTNTLWGKGASSSLINDVSFKSTADTLYKERMGMSIAWSESKTGKEFIDNVLEHINGELYVDRITNQWTLKLIRDDYNINDLVHLTESHYKSLTFERKTLAECINQVTVTYYDRERAKDSTITIQDVARIAQQGCVVSQSIDYKGFSNSSIASRVALRDLKTLSSELASIEFDLPESIAENWHKAYVFKLSNTRYGLSGAVFRVTEIKFGDGVDNTVSIKAIEDSFSSPMQAVVEYIPPVKNEISAKDATAIAFEIPYIELVEQYGQDEIDAKLANNPDLSFVGMAAVRPNNYHINASLYSNAGAGYAEETTLDFCPSATLKTAIGYLDTAFEVENIAEFDLLKVNDRIQLDDELMAFVSFDETTLS